MVPEKVMSGNALVKHNRNTVTSRYRQGGKVGDGASQLNTGQGPVLLVSQDTGRGHFGRFNNVDPVIDRFLAKDDPASQFHFYVFGCFLKVDRTKDGRGAKKKEGFRWM